MIISFGCFFCFGLPHRHEDVTFSNSRIHCSFFLFQWRVTRQGECCWTPSWTLSHSLLLNCTLSCLSLSLWRISFPSSLWSVSALFDTVIDHSLFRLLSPNVSLCATLPVCVCVCVCVCELTFSPLDSKPVGMCMRQAETRWNKNLSSKQLFAFPASVHLETYF